MGGKPRESTRHAATAVTDGEAFPRGGGSAISPLERRQLKRDAEDAAVWDAAAEAQQKKRRGGSNQVCNQSERQSAEAQYGTLAQTRTLSPSAACCFLELLSGFQLYRSLSGRAYS